VPSWLKSLRLHKYAALFSQMSYEEMMTLTEQHLESQVKPLGPAGRHWGQQLQLALLLLPKPLSPCSLLGTSRYFMVPFPASYLLCPYHRMSPKVPATR
jgi:hypothetical protein